MDSGAGEIPTTPPEDGKGHQPPAPARTASKVGVYRWALRTATGHRIQRAAHQMGWGEPCTGWCPGRLAAAPIRKGRERGPAARLKAQTACKQMRRRRVRA
jgi:hypothetical protein